MIVKEDIRFFNEKYSNVRMSGFVRGGMQRYALFANPTQHDVLMKR